MADPIRVMVNGSCGRMGEAVIRLIAGADDLHLTAALERAGHPSIGRDVGEAIGIGPLGVEVGSDLGQGDVLVDFSTPESTATRVGACAEVGVAFVTGTTALDDSQMDAIRRAADRIPCLQSSNMSLGIALATRLVADLATSLKDEFDVEIVETHHRHKKDAPSGTALRLAKAIARAWGESEPRIVHGRSGAGGERGRGEIGIHALRMGEETGDHRVIFSGPGERIQVGHTAHTRQAFASGALRAIRFVHGRSPGLYDISDVFLPR